MAGTHLKHFFNCLVPVYACNLRCDYCFVSQAHMAAGKELVGLDAKQLAQALSIERAGLSLINLCGHGETLLHPDIVPVVQALLAAGQYVAVVTNCTLTRRVEELCTLPVADRARLFIKASFHYEQLKAKKLLVTYFANIERLHAAGISYSLEMVASDSLAPFVPEILDLFRQRGEPLPQVLECRESVSGDIKRYVGLPLAEHTALWQQFHSPLFAGMQSLWGQKRTEFCYAGEYSANINLATGDMIQCNQRRALQNIYQNLDEPLHFCAVGCNCPLTHCYISYAWQGLCGNVKGLAFPSYDSQRNRRYADGTSWLSPTVEKAYNAVIGYCEGYYSVRKEQIVGAFMDAWYGKVVQSETKAAVGAWLQEIVPAGSCIAIYGLGRMGQLVLDSLQAAGVCKVVAVVDRSFTGQADPATSTGKSYASLTPTACWQGALQSLGVTRIIITPFADGTQLAAKIQHVYESKIRSIRLLAALETLK